MMGGITQLKYYGFHDASKYYKIRDENNKKCIRESDKYSSLYLFMYGLKLSVDETITYIQKLCKLNTK
jgi:hypothetical protein